MILREVRRFAKRRRREEMRGEESQSVVGRLQYPSVVRREGRSLNAWLQLYWPTYFQEVRHKRPRERGVTHGVLQRRLQDRMRAQTGPIPTECSSSSAVGVDGGRSLHRKRRSRSRGAASKKTANRPAEWRRDLNVMPKYFNEREDVRESDGDIGASGRKASNVDYTLTNKDTVKAKWAAARLALEAADEHPVRTAGDAEEDVDSESFRSLTTAPGRPSSVAESVMKLFPLSSSFESLPSVGSGVRSQVRLNRSYPANFFNSPAASDHGRRYGRGARMSSQGLRSFSQEVAEKAKLLHQRAVAKQKWTVAQLSKAAETSKTRRFSASDLLAISGDTVPPPDSSRPPGSRSSPPPHPPTGAAFTTRPQHHGEGWIKVRDVALDKSLEDRTDANVTRMSGVPDRDPDDVKDTSFTSSSSSSPEAVSQGSMLSASLGRRSWNKKQDEKVGDWRGKQPQPLHSVQSLSRGPVGPSERQVNPSTSLPTCPWHSHPAREDNQASSCDQSAYLGGRTFGFHSHRVAPSPPGSCGTRRCQTLASSPSRPHLEMVMPLSPQPPTSSLQGTAAQGSHSSLEDLTLEGKSRRCLCTDEGVMAGRDVIEERSYNEDDRSLSFNRSLHSNQDQRRPGGPVLDPGGQRTSVDQRSSSDVEDFLSEDISAALSDTRTSQNVRQVQSQGRMELRHPRCTRRHSSVLPRCRAGDAQRRHQSVGNHGSGDTLARPVIRRNENYSKDRHADARVRRSKSFTSPDVASFARRFPCGRSSSGRKLTVVKNFDSLDDCLSNIFFVEPDLYTAVRSMPTQTTPRRRHHSDTSCETKIQGCDAVRDPCKKAEVAAVPCGCSGLSFLPSDGYHRQQHREHSNTRYHQNADKSTNLTQETTSESDVVEGPQPHFLMRPARSVPGELWRATHTVRRRDPRPTVTLRRSCSHQSDLRTPSSSKYLFSGDTLARPAGHHSGAASMLRSPVKLGIREHIQRRELLELKKLQQKVQEIRRESIKRFNNVENTDSIRKVRERYYRNIFSDFPNLGQSQTTRLSVGGVAGEPDRGGLRVAKPEVRGGSSSSRRKRLVHQLGHGGLGEEPPGQGRYSGVCTLRVISYSRLRPEP